MTSSNLLVPALIFAVVGFLAGVLVMILVGDSRRRREEKEKGGTPMDDLIVPEMPALPESRFESVANLYREKRTGKVVTDIKGKVHINRGTIPSDQLQILQEFARNWQGWLGMSNPPLSAVKPQDNEPRGAIAAETGPVESTPAATEGVPETATPRPEESRMNDPAAAQPADNMEAFVPASITPEPPPVRYSGQPERPRPTSLVAQINDVLQEMLPDSKFADQNIVIGEEPANGVVVWVGAQKTIGIDSVADPELKGLIQAAVRRWENETGHA